MRIPGMLLGVLLNMAALALAAYYPDATDYSTFTGQQQHPMQMQPLQNEEMSARIAWLEYLANVYVEVYNYKRAQRVVEEIRRLSGLSLADASAARLAIDGVLRRMRGFRSAPPRRSKIARKRHFAGAARGFMAGGLQGNWPGAGGMATQYSGVGSLGGTGDYWQRIMAGDRGATANFAYYQPNQPGAVFNMPSEQVAWLRQQAECPNCPPGPHGLRHLPQQTLVPPSPSHPFGVAGQPRRLARGALSTDNVHRLLFLGQLDEANRLFAQLVQNRTSRTRPIYRLELVLSLVDLDLTDPNDCVPLWDAAWRLSWRDKLKIVDIYRSGRRAAYLDDSLFAAVSRSRFRRQIIARIKTILGAPDALRSLARIPTKADFYMCAACYARKRVGTDGYGRMQRLLLRAVHDADLPPAYRRHFRLTLNRSFRPDRFDPRVRYFPTVYPRDLAFSIITGEYRPLYGQGDEWDSRPAYHSAFSATGRGRRWLGKLGRPYRALKSPRPIAQDRQEVLLDALADGSPTTLSLMLNRPKHRLVRHMLASNEHLNLRTALKDLERFEREQRKTAKKAAKKQKALQRKQQKKLKKMLKSGQITQDDLKRMEEEDEAMQASVDAASQELREGAAAVLGDMSRLIDRAVKIESVGLGGAGDARDQFNMAFADYDTMAMTPAQHRAYLRQLKDVQKRLKRLRKKAGRRGDNILADRYAEQEAYLSRVQETLHGMGALREQLARYERKIQRHSRQAYDTSEEHPY